MGTFLGPEEQNLPGVFLVGLFKGLVHPGEAWTSPSWNWEHKDVGVLGAGAG